MLGAFSTNLTIWELSTKSSSLRGNSISSRAANAPNVPILNAHSSLNSIFPCKLWTLALSNFFKALRVPFSLINPWKNLYCAIGFKNILSR